MELKGYKAQPVKIPNFTKGKTEILIIKNVSILKYLLILCSLFFIFPTCFWNKILTYILSVLEYFTYAYKNNKNYFSEHLSPSQITRCEIFPDRGKFLNLEEYHSLEERNESVSSNYFIMK